MERLEEEEREREMDEMKKAAQRQYAAMQTHRNGSSRLSIFHGTAR